MRFSAALICLFILDGAFYKSLLVQNKNECIPVIFGAKLHVLVDVYFLRIY